MKIALLSGASSIHTIRWANGLYDAGHEVHVITQQPPLEPFNEGVEVHQFPSRGIPGYFSMARGVRRLLKRIRPDIVNAHYASGYGTTARVVDFHPYVLSVWGSDVYDLPRKSPIHRWLVRRNLLAADRVASTSHCMAGQTREIAPSLGKNIAVTPFGVDIARFGKVDPIEEVGRKRIVIGTVKVLSNKYGMDTLIHAFAELKRRLLNQSNTEVVEVELRIVGDGPELKALQTLARTLEIQDSVTFVGRVPHLQVPEELAKMDIYVALSRLDSESFGVAIIEAGAAGRPVVVSDAGGLPEVTLNGITGLVVPREDPHAAADALETLVRNPEQLRRMGEAGRRHVQQNYSWDVCISTMLQLYSDTIQESK